MEKELSCTWISGVGSILTVGEGVSVSPIALGTFEPGYEDLCRSGPPPRGFSDLPRYKQNRYLRKNVASTVGQPDAGQFALRLSESDAKLLERTGEWRHAEPFTFVLPGGLGHRFNAFVGNFIKFNDLEWIGNIRISGPVEFFQCGA